jgi:hypothetical protein
MGMIGKLIPTMVKGIKMVQSGSSDQEARSYMESQGLRNIQISKPSLVDVTSEGMKKKNLPRGTGVTYSGVRTSSQGLLTGARTEKKTLLGG